MRRAVYRRKLRSIAPSNQDSGSRVAGARVYGDSEQQQSWMVRRSSRFAQWSVDAAAENSGVSNDVVSDPIAPLTLPKSLRSFARRSTTIDTRG